jgi:hypothetical protein
MPHEAREISIESPDASPVTEAAVRKPYEPPTLGKRGALSKVVASAISPKDNEPELLLL